MTQNSKDGGKEKENALKEKAKLKLNLEIMEN
jgi:hypothetical protein